METIQPPFSIEEAEIKYVCGIDIGSQSCAGCITRPDKSVVVKSTTFTNAREGWKVWEEKLNESIQNRVLDIPFYPLICKLHSEQDSNTRF